MTLDALLAAYRAAPRNQARRHVHIANRAAVHDQLRREVARHVAADTGREPGLAVTWRPRRVERQMRGVA